MVPGIMPVRIMRHRRHDVVERHASPVVYSACWPVKEQPCRVAGIVKVTVLAMSRLKRIGIHHDVTHFKLGAEPFREALLRIHTHGVNRLAKLALPAGELRDAIR